MTTDDVPSDPAPVQSVARAMRLVRCFDGHPHRKNLAGMARCAGLTPSTAHRLLQSLCATGVLQRSRDADDYALGPLVLDLARSVYQDLGLTDATDALHRLVLRSGASASYGTRDGDDVVVLLRASAPGPQARHGRPGTRSPLHATAMGKALLAFAADEGPDLVERLLPLRSYTPRTITDPQLLLTELTEIRRTGFAVSDGEQFLGVRAVAAPALAPDGTLVGAVAVYGDDTQVAPAMVDDLSAVVREVGDEMGSLGFGGLLGGAGR